MWWLTSCPEGSPRIAYGVTTTAVRIKSKMKALRVPGCLVAPRLESGKGAGVGETDIATRLVV
jgi:hypothetical protein